MCFSPEAKAIQALCNEIDKLANRSSSLSGLMLRRHEQYICDLQTIQAKFMAEIRIHSNEQREIVAKISANQEAISQLQRKNFTPKLYPEDADCTKFYG